jgi:hypothetical protein
MSMRAKAAQMAAMDVHASVPASDLLGVHSKDQSRRQADCYLSLHMRCMQYNLYTDVGALQTCTIYMSAFLTSVSVHDGSSSAQALNTGCRQEVRWCEEKTTVQRCPAGSFTSEELHACITFYNAS